jgi:hypothetical protein
VNHPVERSEAKKKKPAMASAMINKIKQGIAPWRGMAEALLSVDFFLIFGAAIQNGRCTASTDEFASLFLEQAIKCGAGIGRVSRRRTRSVFTHSTGCTGGQRITRDCHARGKEIARIGLVLERNANRNRPHALEPGRRLEVHALLATVQSCVALRALALEVHIRC